MKSTQEQFNENNSRDSLEFSISRFHQGRHIVALILTGGLCFSLVMSEISYHMSAHSHHYMHLKQMLIPYLLLLIFVGVIALTTIMTVCKIKIKPEGLEIKNLLWTERLAWTDLKAFSSSQNLKFAWLQTKRSFYIMVKNEFRDWFELEKRLQYRQIKS